MQRASNGAAAPAKATESSPMATASHVVSPFPMTGVQRRVKVGESGDPAEHEADRVADHVSSGSSQARGTVSRLMSLQRKEAGRDEAQRKEDGDHAAETSQGSIKRAAMSGEQPEASVRRAETSAPRQETPVQRAGAGEPQPDSAVQRCCCCPAEQMDHRPSGTASVQCKAAESDTAESVHRKADAGMDAVAEHAIATKGSGAPLRPHVLQKLESRMGADLGGVRVHEGPAAHESASALNAKAFTHKGDIWLGRGESQDNLHLMAHEATHVVQQGAAVRRSDSAIRRDEDRQPTVRRSIWDRVTGVAGAVWDATGGRVVDAAGKVLEMGADFFWKIVREVAPAWVIDIIQGIREKGIVGYLRDKVSRAFDSIFGGLSSGGGLVATVIQTFNNLMKTGREIVTALGHNDCKPLFDAVTRLGDTLSEMAGHAWEKIKNFFAPVGDFFKNLWQKFGAPVVDFLSDFASDVWSEIKALGQKIWDGTKPVRDAAAAAWKWVKDELGIGDEPEGQNGLLQWVQGKLSDAWTWFKDKLQPVIGPMKALVDKVKSILPLDEILNLRQTVHDWLHHASQMVTSLRKPKGVTKDQEALRGQILPAVKAAIVGLRSRIVAAGTWVTGQIGGIVTTVTGLFAGLKSNSILGHLTGAIQWVQDSVADLGHWASSTVTSLFGAIGNGVAKLADFIEPVLGVLKKIVSVVTNVVKELPGLVMGPIWKAIPACISDPIKDFIIENILSSIPIISTFLKIPEIWSKIQKLVMDFLTKVFVNGDLGGAVMMVIRFVLEAAGLNVDLMLSVLAKAADTLDEIIMNPVKFLSHLAAAVGQGLKRFVSNIGTHLLTGLVNWLVGPLKELGVEPIKDLSLTSIMGLVLGVLGISEAKLRAKAEKAIGPTAVKVLTEAWKWIKALIAGGIGGLWNEIKDQLSNLWGSIIGGISQWITVDLVEAGVAKLVKLCNPVGAIIEALQTIYKAITFLVSKANEILAIVDSVLDSIQRIVAGNIGAAAAWIETALARTVPAVLAFFAKWIGISDPGPKVKEIVVKIQGSVEKALDWLVNKAIEIGKKILGALGLGGKDEEDPKWKAGVEGVSSDVKKMKEAGLEEKDVRDKFPLWKSQYGFSNLELNMAGDDIEILGSMSPKNKRVTKAGTGLHSGTKSDPIPIYWYKPESAYPNPIKLTDPADDKIITVPMVSRTPVSDKYLGSTTLGIYKANEITEGKVVERTSGTDDLRGGKQDSIRRLFRRFGYDMEKKKEDADHVKDLAFGGVDDFSNLWPLDEDTNRRGLKYANSYMVEYIENKTIQKASVKSLDGKSFRIKGFRYPPPEKVGGRDSE